MKIIEAIRDCGLTYVRKHRISDGIDLYEATHKVENVAFGQYLLVPLSLEQFLAVSEDSASYSAFEESALSSFYFRLRGDWGWNLYLCLILADRDLEQVPLAKLAQVERGKKYGKKIVIGWSDVRERLPAAKIPDRMPGDAAADPSVEWQTQLAPLGLEFCLLDDYRESRLESYLLEEQQPPIRPTGGNPSDEPVIKPVGPIQSLQFGSLFRPHLLSHTSKLDFVKVNLLYGPNGMGKTSVLEGIELSFTGNVQRNLLSQSREQEDWDGIMTFAGNGQVFDGMPNEQERRERETVYYKHKVAPRARSQINRVFHQYNFFSSEAVYQFSYNPDARADYRNDFARVIYGEQLERMEKRYIQYKREFERENNRLSKRIGEMTAAMESEQSDDYQATGIIQERAAAGAMSMKKWIHVCRLAYPTLDDRATLREIEEWQRHFAPIINQLVVKSSFLLGDSKDVPDNAAALSSSLIRLKTEGDRLASSKQEMAGNLEALPDIRDLQAKATEDETSRHQRSARIARLADLAVRFQDYKKLYDHPQRRQLRRELQARKSELMNKGARLQSVFFDYRHLMGQKVEIADLPGEERRLTELEAYYMEAMSRFEEAAKQAEAHHGKVGKLKRLASELKLLGQQYLRDHPEEKHCPLCGHDHEDRLILEEAVDKGVLAEDEALAKLLKEQERIRAAAVKIEQDRNDLAAQINRYKEHKTAFERMTGLAGEAGMQAYPSFTPEALQNYFMQLNDRLEANRESLRRVDEEIHQLDHDGFTLAALSGLDELLTDPELAFLQAETDGGMPSEQVLYVLQHEQEALTSEVKQLLNSQSELQERIGQIHSLKQQYQEQLEEMDARLHEYAGRLQALNRIRDAFASLSENNVRLGDSDSWSEWRSCLLQLQRESDSLKQALEPAVLIEHREGRIEDYRSELRQLTVRNERCRQALDALSRLRPLAEYGADFVKSNFEAISRLFVALHAPNEFAGLHLTGDNQITAIRKSLNSHCAIHQMSTGQRTAVILAIFFVMHLVMDTAPKFLMLDEPVANMDELNVLGLLDFLRQLAVTKGTQIFFTTANPQVATLFRRKFSFFKEDFRAYHFQRLLEGPVQIQVQQFVPQLEKPVLSYRL
ncbi:AAA family ATPase [Paenibacillus harenae]|uniref:AAA family ATPase n=1 Tax=Paenibacillus harenae TaxID=306543 RepID=UPI0004096DAB|nr:hypothetical protein [Paenibacillus harenae]